MIHVDFGNHALPGSIHGQKWHDLNGDGVKDPGEPGLQGWTIFLDENGNGLLDLPIQNIASTDVPKPITDYTTITSQVSVSGLDTLHDLNVTLDIAHTYDADLHVYLTSPSGTRVELFTKVGESGDNFQNTTLDDEAVTPITSGTAPFSGSFRPEGSLADFDGEDPNGLWTLEVSDNAGDDTGFLNGWSLTVTSGEESTTTDAAGNYWFMDLVPGDYVVGEVLLPGWEQTFPAGSGNNLRIGLLTDGIVSARRE